MKTVILADGLGGNPEFTFYELLESLNREGHRVILVSQLGIRTHEDRINKIFAACQQRWDYLDQVHLVGFSAGASACRYAAAKAEKFHKKVASVNLLAQAMPSGYDFETKTLKICMCLYLQKVLRGQDIKLHKFVYRTLTGPIDPKLKRASSRNILKISGKEAHALAFFPPNLELVNSPLQIFIPKKDRWISPRAQMELAVYMTRCNFDSKIVEVPESGHLLLASKNRQEIISNICSWIKTH